MLFATLVGLGLLQTFPGTNPITGIIGQLNTGTHKFASSGIVIQNPTTFTTTLAVTLGAIPITSDTIDYTHVRR